MIRIIATQDYEDIYDLNTELGYAYEKDKVYNKIIAILEAGNDILLAAEKDGHVVAYAHGAPYETLYADNLLNTVCFCVKTVKQSATHCTRHLNQERRNSVIRESA